MYNNKLIYITLNSTCNSCLSAHKNRSCVCIETATTRLSTRVCYRNAIGLVEYFVKIIYNVEYLIMYSFELTQCLLFQNLKEKKISYQLSFLYCIDYLTFYNIQDFKNLSILLPIKKLNILRSQYRIHLCFCI